MIHLPKSEPAPACLEIEKAKASGSYNCGDVLERLQTDFKNKCYLCEYKAPTSINTEHFIAHKGNPDLKFDWKNLFYCCAHCNNTKLDKYDDILNCTLDAEIERRIKYEMRPIPKEKVKISALENDPQVHNTVRLLDEIYNGTTPLKLIEAANLRTHLLKEIREFLELLFEFDDDGYDPDEKEYFRRKILQHLKPNSNFTAFKRWIIRDSETFATEFHQFI
jgi:hypothetical protein